VAFLGTFVVRHSGATVRDLHPIPYSPLIVIRGTRSCVPGFRPKLFKEPKTIFGDAPILLAVWHSVTRLSQKSSAHNFLYKAADAIDYIRKAPLSDQVAAAPPSHEHQRSCASPETQYRNDLPCPQSTRSRCAWNSSTRPSGSPANRLST
jgi:hypothetical protein